MSLPNQTEQVGDHNVLRYVTKIPMGYGGGVCMSFLGMSLYTIAQVTYRNVFVARNTAIAGGNLTWRGWSRDLKGIHLGGLSVHTEDTVWNRDDKLSCFPSIPGFDTCQKFDIHNITVTQNTATRVGGIFLSRPDAIAVSCDLGEKKWMATRDAHSANLTAQLLPYCTRVEANNNADGSDSQSQMGTNAVALRIERGLDRLAGMVSGETLSAPCRQDATENKCPLHIEIKDAFNQTIRAPIDDAGLDLTLESDAIIGDLKYTASDGVASISNTRAWGINTTDTLTVFSQRDPNMDIRLQFSTRECYPGEIAQRNVCYRCPVEQYGFHSTSGTCQGCELHAHCSGGSALIPDDGYWHATPFSPVMRKCIHLEACRYDGRAEILGLFSKDPVALQEKLDSLNAHIAEEGPEPAVDLAYPQCSEGYKGPLCGSCRNGYGHSYTGECESCPKNADTNGLFIFLIALWLFVFIGINCVVSLASIKSHVERVKLETRPATSSFREKGGHRDSPAPETVTIAELLESARPCAILWISVYLSMSFRYFLNW